MARITVHKGLATGDMKVYDMQLDATLDAIRKRLVSDGFLPADSQTAKFRFILAQSTSSNFEDAVCPVGLEYKFALSDALKSGSQLIFTNISKVKDVDFVGIGTSQFFSRYLGVSISLNTNDPAAIASNSSKQAFPPLMLSNVYPTNPNVTGVYDNVCVVVDGSIVSFNIASWGSAGFNYYIGPDSGKPIVDGDLYVPFHDSMNQFGYTSIYRYSAKEQTIQIVGADEVGIVGKEAILRFQKVTIRSRRLTYYEQGGRTFQSDQTPPPLAPPRAKTPLAARPGAAVESFSIERQLAAAGQVGTVPGEGIKPGGPIEGPGSQQQWAGTIYNARTDDWSQALGEIVIYFFVFKTWDDANQIINGYNAPDPTLWG